jgi:hypothetical protein
VPVLSEYTTLANTDVAAGDKIPVTDVSAPATKNVLASKLLQALFLVADEDFKLASHVVSVGPNGATNPAFQADGATASMVNGVKVAGTATADSPVVSAIGSADNVTLELDGKGTGGVRCGVCLDVVTQTAKTDTATLTIAELLTKVIDGTPTAPATYTLPTAALLVAGIPNCKVGDSFAFLVNNKSGANAITVAAGAGGTADGTLTVAVNVVREFRVIVTNVTGSSEAYFVYGLGA